jgi:RNA polymerase sigma-70 factor (ECF subfamily)
MGEQHLFPGDPADAAGGRTPKIQGGPDSPDAKHPQEFSADPSNVIVQGFLDGRPEDVRQVAAWAKIVAEHRVWGFETSEDTVQATLLAVVQNLRDGRFKGGDLRAYVRRIAKNMCITNYRRLKSRGEHVSLDRAPDPPAPGASGSDIEHRVMLDRILDQLSQGCREIILFAYVQGFSRKEIGDRLGISEESARVRLFRCIQNARALLTDP